MGRWLSAARGRIGASGQLRVSCVPSVAGRRMRSMQIGMARLLTARTWRPDDSGSRYSAFCKWLCEERRNPADFQAFQVAVRILEGFFPRGKSGEA